MFEVVNNVSSELSKIKINSIYTENFNEKIENNNNVIVTCDIQEKIMNNL